MRFSLRAASVDSMMATVRSVLLAARSFLRTQRELALENLALRHQLAVLRRTNPGRVTAKRIDRALWSWIAGAWKDWRSASLLWQPDTIIRWHREGFRSFWARKSRRTGRGRPALDAEIRTLIMKMREANPLWGAPRIHGELKMLGIDAGQTTVGKYLPKHGRRPPPSQMWRSFLKNHVNDLVSIDFFTVPTATFRVLYGFVVLAHARRRVLHFNVTANPSAAWTARQIVQAFPFDSAPRHLMRDRDCIYGDGFGGVVQTLGTKEVLSAPRSPWQNPFVERWIGSLRRDCLDHHVVLGEEHLLRIIRTYVDYYQRDRTHLALDKDAPGPRATQPLSVGRVVALPRVGGLHHRYERLAA